MVFCSISYTIIGKSDILKIIQHILTYYCDRIDVDSLREMSLNPNNVFHYLKFVMQKRDGIEAKHFVLPVFRTIKVNLKYSVIVAMIWRVWFQ